MTINTNTSKLLILFHFIFLFSSVPAIPIIHCNPNNKGGQYNCPYPTTNTSQPLYCLQYFNDHNIDFNYRTRVYYGQYRTICKYFLIINLLLWQFSMNFNTIVDSLYAVYEASTLELWSFMMYNAIDGNNAYSAGIFYFFLVLFIVILLQVRAKPHLLL